MEGTIQQQKSRIQRPEAPPPHHPRPLLCRGGCPTATVHVPASVFARVAKEGTDGTHPVPVSVGFDAAGPHLCVAVGGYRANVPFTPAALQKETYYNGQRYWRKWQEQEERVNSDAASADDAAADAVKKRFMVGVGAISLLIVLGLCLGAVLSRTDRDACPVPQPPASSVPSASSVHYAPHAPLHNHHPLQSRTSQIDLSRLREAVVGGV